MIKYIAMLFVTVLTSMYFFPFEFFFLPGVNTKMMMAVVGLIIFGYRIAQSKYGYMSKNLFLLTMFGAGVSFFGFLSVTVNETPDYAYATYLMSMWVWIGGAYAVCNIIKGVHGYIDFRLACNYLTVVCVSQCVLAMMIDNIPEMKRAVDSVVMQGQTFLNESNVRRLYGIGASLDVAGSRFSVVLVLLAFIIKETFEKHEQLLLSLAYLICFFAIAVMGNMVARTTTVGLAVALVYWLLDSGLLKLQVNREYRALFGTFLVVLLVAVPLLVTLYETNPETRKLLRFAFEGFFSLAEQGSWEVASNDKLRTMYVFPETMKTWLIGDGYFSSPQNVDPYYTGPIRGGYYMGTDVGYLRFIFYFGTLGLAAFSIFMGKVTQLCIRQFKEYKIVFLMFLAVNFIVWFKVATDVFLIFALFLMFPTDDGEDVETEEVTA